MPALDNVAVEVAGQRPALPLVRWSVRFALHLAPQFAGQRTHRIIDGERDLPVIDNYEIGLLHRADADDAVRALASELWRQVQREPD